MKKYFLSISLAFIFCGSSFGQTNVVFAEYFDVPSYPDCGGYARLQNDANRGITYTYAPLRNRTDMSSDRADGVSHCGTTGICDINDGAYDNSNIGEYAIVRHSQVSWWCARTRVDEHTQDPVNHPNSGAILVNANSDLNQYFYTQKLDNLCPSTQYEFSAWYASIARPDEEPSNIIFEIFEGGTLNSTTGVHTGGTRIQLPDGQTGATGLFGGWQGRDHDPSVRSFLWLKKTINFSTPTSALGTEYFLKLKNNHAGTDGNDLMIDDIMVVKYTRAQNLFEVGTPPYHSLKEVYNDDRINLFVTLSASDVSLISESRTVYAQLMSSANLTNWTAVVSPDAFQTLTNEGTFYFSVAPPASAGSTVYYRVKLSADANRAQDIDSELVSEFCYNDVITQRFTIIRKEPEGVLGGLVVCGDDNAVFELLVLPTDNLFPTHYQIDFADTAFQDIPKTSFNGGNIIEIQIPVNIYPDNYIFTLTLYDDVTGAVADPVVDTLKVLYPSRIMEQKWDDVIALLNKDACGYAFAGYQWYKNGDIMQGENRAYIYLAPQKLDTAACYQALITRADGSQAFSCCAKLKAFEAAISAPTIDVSQRDGVIGISHIKENSTIFLYTITGVLLQSHKVTTSEYELRAPNKGMYLLEIRTGADRQVVPIVVSR